jgi:hypothetical protein
MTRRFLGGRLDCPHDLGRTSLRPSRENVGLSFMVWVCLIPLSPAGWAKLLCCLQGACFDYLTAARHATRGTHGAHAACAAPIYLPPPASSLQTRTWVASLLQGNTRLQKIPCWRHRVPMTCWYVGHTGILSLDALCDWLILDRALLI